LEVAFCDSTDGGVSRSTYPNGKGWPCKRDRCRQLSEVEIGLERWEMGDGLRGLNSYHASIILLGSNRSSAHVLEGTVIFK
jgi:hypothetical protein